MQEEVTQRTVALCVEATKLSAGMLQQAMKKVLDEMQKGVTGHKTKLHHGKQTLRQLILLLVCCKLLCAAAEPLCTRRSQPPSIAADTPLRQKESRCFPRAGGPSRRCSVLP